MNFNVVWLTLGGFGFLLRAWAVEIKLEPELLYRRHYIDRFLAYYSFLAMMFEFESAIFNLLTLFSLPGIIIAFIGLDIPFFLKFSKRTYWKEHIGILWFERITLHLPGLIIGLVLLIREISIPIESENYLIDGLAACILILFPLLTMDHRIKYNESKPQRSIIITVLSLEIVALVIYLVFRTISVL